MTTTFREAILNRDQAEITRYVQAYRERGWTPTRLFQAALKVDPNLSVLEWLNYGPSTHPAFVNVVWPDVKEPIISPFQVARALFQAASILYANLPQDSNALGQHVLRVETYQTRGNNQGWFRGNSSHFTVQLNPHNYTYDFKPFRSQS